MTTPVTPATYDYDPGEDMLAAQVGARETERIVADPEIDAKPTITRVESGKQGEPQPVDPDPSMTEGRYR